MYAWITAFRSWFFDKGIFKSSQFDLPIINVGNLAVGGSGKTPHIEYLIRLLSNQFKVATLSRGYGRKTKGFREVFADNLAEDAGDEPLQIKRSYPQAEVFVAESRVEGVTQMLFAAPEIDVILLDDAYQHRAIQAGFSILLTDFAKPFTQDKSLPIGRLREFPKAAGRADVVVVTKCPLDISAKQKAALQNEIKAFTPAPILFSGLEYGELRPMNEEAWNSQKTDNLLVISALANPSLMLHYIKSQFSPKQLEHIEFRDHHNFTKKEVLSFVDKFHNFAAQNKAIIVSEKDAARLRSVIVDTEFERLPVFVLPIQVVFLDEDQQYFNQKILKYVRENSADHQIHSEQDEL